MNKQQSVSDNLVNQAALLAVQGNGGGSTQDRLTEILIKRFEKENAEEELKADQVLAFKTAQLSAIQKTMDDKKLSQERCPHMKENRTSAVGGQKDHSGNYHFLCQFCQREWVNDLPHYLQIPGDRVGGPQ